VTSEKLVRSAEGLGCEMIQKPSGTFHSWEYYIIPVRRSINADPCGTYGTLAITDQIVQA
jgi:hypothetical protein